MSIHKMQKLFFKDLHFDRKKKPIQFWTLKLENDITQLTLVCIAMYHYHHVARHPPPELPPPPPPRHHHRALLTHMLSWQKVNSAAFPSEFRSEFLKDSSLICIIPKQDEFNGNRGVHLWFFVIIILQFRPEFLGKSSWIQLMIIIMDYGRPERK